MRGRGMMTCMSGWSLIFPVWSRKKFCGTPSAIQVMLANIASDTLQNENFQFLQLQSWLKVKKWPDHRLLLLNDCHGQNQGQGAFDRSKCMFCQEKTKQGNKNRNKRPMGHDSFTWVNRPLHICKCNAKFFQYCHSNWDRNLTVP